MLFIFTFTIVVKGIFLQKLKQDSLRIQTSKSEQQVSKSHPASIFLCPAHSFSPHPFPQCECAPHLSAPSISISTFMELWRPAWLSAIISYKVTPDFSIT